MGRVTHRCAVLGMPIAHSLSPVLHHAAYAALGLSDWAYERIEMRQDDLPGFLASLDDTWAGLSLTMPLKRTVMVYGKPEDYWSRTLGVANTVVIDHAVTDHAVPLDDVDASNGAATRSHPRMRLFNTDVDGIRLALARAWTDHGMPVPDMKDRDGHAAVVILGNGNTALSALAACSTLSPHLTVQVAARHPSSGAALRDFATMSTATGTHRIELLTLALDAVCPAMGRADIVISTLPAHAADPIAREWGVYAGHPGHRMRNEPATLLDVAYAPRPSALVSGWRHAGGLALSGEEMLLYQAIEQVRLMTAPFTQAPFTEAPPRDAPPHLTDPGRPPRIQRPPRTPSVDVRLENAMRAALREVL